MTTLQACPCCGENKFFEVAAVFETPVSGIFRKLASEPQPRHALAFDACTTCGLLRNRQFASPPSYEEKPRATDRQFPKYHDALLSLIGASVKPTDLIVEIGSNDGTFLDLLMRNGFGNTYGVEPSSTLAEVSRVRGFQTESGYFGQELVRGLLDRHGPVKMAVCRHTLEHVPDPASFVSALRELLIPGSACALIEVPESSVIAERMNFVELWDEHLYYFTAATLRRLFERNGLTVRAEAVYPHLDTRNLVMVVAPAEGCADNAPKMAYVNELALWQDFSHRFKTTSAQLFRVMRDAERPLYLIGASHPQCNFVSYLGVDDCVDFMIDDDLNKHGKLPSIRSEHVCVLSSAEFMACADGGTLLMSGFGYPAWTDRLVNIALSRGMRVIDPSNSFLTSDDIHPVSE